MANPSLDLRRAAQLAEDAQKHSELNRNLIMAVLWVAVGVSVTLLLAVGGLWQNYLAEKRNAYQSLVDKITEQNVKIDLLYDEMRSERQEVAPSVPAPTPVKK